MHMGNNRQKAPLLYNGVPGEETPLINTLNVPFVDPSMRKPADVFVNPGKGKGTKDPKTRTIPPTSTDTRPTGHAEKHGLPQSQQKDHNRESLRPPASQSQQYPSRAAPLPPSGSQHVLFRSAALNPPSSQQQQQRQVFNPAATKQQQQTVPRAAALNPSASQQQQQPVSRAVTLNPSASQQQQQLGSRAAAPNPAASKQQQQAVPRAAALNVSASQQQHPSGSQQRQGLGLSVLKRPAASYPSESQSIMHLGKKVTWNYVLLHVLMHSCILWWFCRESCTVFRLALHRY